MKKHIKDCGGEYEYKIYFDEYEEGYAHIYRECSCGWIDSIKFGTWEVEGGTLRGIFNANYKEPK